MKQAVCQGRLRPMTSVYLQCAGRIALLYRQGSRIIPDSYVGTAGGHMEPREIGDARACVLRELREETGLGEEHLRELSLRYITLRAKNGEIRQNYYFFAQVDDPSLLKSSNEGRLRWFDLAEISALDMPVSAKFMILHYLRQGRFDSHLYAGITTENGIDFVPLEEF